jgi:hypothetical protein
MMIYAVMSIGHKYYMHYMRRIRCLVISTVKKLSGKNQKSKEEDHTSVGEYKLMDV